jgi:tetratricopeptide (TPR) repeat protein
MPVLKVDRILVPLLILVLFRWTAAVFPRTVDGLSVADSERLSQQVTSAIKDRRWTDAAADLQKLLTAYPNNAIYLQKMAQTQKGLGHASEEIAAWEKFWDVSPTRIEACGDLVDVYKKTQQQKKVMETAQRCFDVDPLNTDSIFELALANERDGNRKRAMELYQEGLKISPNYVDMEVGLARLELADGATDSAIARCLDAISRDPRQVDAMATLATAYRVKGNFNEARRVLEKGLAISDTYTDMHFALAGIAADQKDLETARKHYERVIELDSAGTLGGMARERLQTLKVPR